MPICRALRHAPQAAGASDQGLRTSIGRKRHLAPRSASNASCMATAGKVLALPRPSRRRQTHDSARPAALRQPPAASRSRACPTRAARRPATASRNVAPTKRPVSELSATRTPSPRVAASICSAKSSRARIEDVRDAQPGAGRRVFPAIRQWRTPPRRRGCASASAASPTPPVAAWINTRSPALRIRQDTARRYARSGSDRQWRRQYRNGRRPGNRRASSARTSAWVAIDPCARATTRSPRAKPTTPGPTSSTTPAHSPPNGTGAPGYAPNATSVSRKFTPVACTRTCICPGPGLRRQEGLQRNAVQSLDHPWTTCAGPAFWRRIRRRRGARTSSPRTASNGSLGERSASRSDATCCSGLANGSMSMIRKRRSGCSSAAICASAADACRALPAWPAKPRRLVRGSADHEHEGARAGIGGGANERQHGAIIRSCRRRPAVGREARSKPGPHWPFRAGRSTGCAGRKPKGAPALGLDRCSKCTADAA